MIPRNPARLFVLFLFLLSPHGVSAMNLAEMQQAAVENRALVKRYQAEIDKSAEDIRIAKSPFYPSVDVSYDAWAVDEPSTIDRRENSAFTSGVTWNVFKGLKDSYLVDSAEARQAVEGYRLKAIVQDIQLAVALRYLDVYNQRARLEVAQDSLKTLERLYLDSENRYNVGLLDKNEVLKFKVDYANAKLAVQREEADLRKAVNDLSRATNIDIDYETLAFSEFSETPTLEDKAGYERAMLAQRSELKTFEGLIAAAEYTAKAQYGDYYPRLDLAGRYRNYDDSLINGQGEFTDEELRAELVLTFNLFKGFLDEAEIARAKAEARSLNYDLYELQHQLQIELRNLFVDYEVSLANVEVAREDIAYADENVRITELKYKEGLQRQLDLLDAIANRTRAQSNFVAVVRTVFENYFRIQRMVEGFPAAP